jgi:hypothetical protein
MIQLGGMYYTVFSPSLECSGNMVRLIKMCLNETYSTVIIGKNLMSFLLRMEGNNEMPYHHFSPTLL